MDQSPKDRTIKNTKTKAQESKEGKAEEKNPFGYEVQKFKRPPFADEIFNKEKKQKFDKLPGAYRKFVDELVKSGDIKASMKFINKEIDLAKITSSQKNVQQALIENGINAPLIAAKLTDCLEAKTFIKDRNGVVLSEIVDYKTVLKTVELISKLYNWTSAESVKESNRDKGVLEMFEED